MHRRATLMLAIGGLVGIAAPSEEARAEPRKPKGGSGRWAAVPNEASRSNMTAEMASQFQNLKTAGSERQVVAIRYHHDTYVVTTADGRSADFWEANLRFKIDSSDTGPLVGKPVILPTGMMGDRASVFFASPAEISALIEHRS